MLSGGIYKMAKASLSFISGQTKDPYLATFTNIDNFYGQCEKKASQFMKDTRTHI